jgi:hypothetical protein
MRPRVRSSSWPLPCSTAPPGISTFSATTASRTWAIDRPYEFSFSMSTTMWISRARLPAIVTWPTPLTVWIARDTCLSATSVSVLRLIASDDTISDITGSASGSTFVITGGSSSGGTLLIAPATFSRTSLTASLRSRSSTKRTVMLPPPSLMRAEISSMPATPLIASSIGSMTDDEISSGLAPGSDSRTFTVAGSARGKRSTPRSRNEKIPSTTSDITSMVAKTGRLTQSSDNISDSPGPYSSDFLAADVVVTFMPSVSLSMSLAATRSPAFTPLRISTRSPMRSPIFSSCAVSLSPSMTKTRLTP